MKAAAALLAAAILLPVAARAAGPARVRCGVEVRNVALLNAGGVPVKGILDLFGLKMDDLMKLPAGSGVKAEGDDLLIDATALMPPPKTEGRLQSVSISGNHLTMHMAGAGAPAGRPTTLP